jgi:hypothetical protein
MELTLSETSLVVFVDDTGHEALIKGHTVYGLGGCAVLGAELDGVIRTPWREVRRKITGSANTVEGKSGFAPDFKAVFHDQDPKRVSFILVDAVDRRGPLIGATLIALALTVLAVLAYTALQWNWTKLAIW